MPNAINDTLWRNLALRCCTKQIPKHECDEMDAVVSDEAIEYECLCSHAWRACGNASHRIKICLSYSPIALTV